MSVDTSTPGTTYGTEETKTAFDEAFEPTDADDEAGAYPATFLCETWWGC